MPLSTRGGGLTGGTADMSPGCSASICETLDGSLDGSSGTCEAAHDTPSAAARANITAARGRVRDRDPASMAAAKRGNLMKAILPFRPAGSRFPRLALTLIKCEAKQTLARLSSSLSPELLERLARVSLASHLINVSARR